MKKIVVLGAAGGLGLALCQYLSGLKKYKIRGSIAPWDDKRRVIELKQYIDDLVIGDITREDNVRQMLAGMETAVNCAAVLPGQGDRERQFLVNVQANEIIMRTARALGLKQMIFISTAGVASWGREKIGDETASFREAPNNHVLSKIKNEKNLELVSREINYYCLILRPVSIYGPHMTFRWREIIEYIVQGRFIVFDHPRARYPLIHERDLARAIELALVKIGKLTANEVIIVSSEEPTTLGGIVDFMARELKVLPPRRWPYWLILLGSYFIDLLPAALKPKPWQLINPRSVREYRSGHLYDTQKAKKLLGFTAEIKFEEGMREALKLYSLQ